MNSHEVFIHIHQGCFAGTGAIVRLPQCQWSKPDGYGKISQCITTTKHSKAKTVCIFLGIYCSFWTNTSAITRLLQCNGITLKHMSKSGQYKTRAKKKKNANRMHGCWLVVYVISVTSHECQGILKITVTQLSLFSQAKRNISTQIYWQFVRVPPTIARASHMETFTCYHINNLIQTHEVYWQCSMRCQARITSILYICLRQWYIWNI